MDNYDQTDIVVGCAMFGFVMFATAVFTYCLCVRRNNKTPDIVNNFYILDDESDDESVDDDDESYVPDDDESDVSDDDDIPVFRFMDGSSFYILDDDDEIVLVASNKSSKRIIDVENIEMRRITRSYPVGCIIMTVIDINKNRIRIRMSKFYDDFECEMFKEFLEEHLLMKMD